MTDTTTDPRRDQAGAPFRPRLRCPECGTPARGIFCYRCGASLGGDTCRQCGSATRAGSRFCAACGHEMSPPSRPSRIARLLPWLRGASVVAALAPPAGMAG